MTVDEILHHSKFTSIAVGLSGLPEGGYYCNIRLLDDGEGPLVFYKGHGRTPEDAINEAAVKSGLIRPTTLPGLPSGLPGLPGLFTR